MLTELEKKVADYIRENGLFDSESKVLLAVSGGADSTALLYILNALKSEGFIKSELLCAHLNHQLRPVEADKDESFVLSQATELGLTAIIKRFDVRGYAKNHKLSIETAARQLRIKSLIEIAKQHNCRFVVTAHQKNDNAETVLQRLSRGTGFRGLAGIWPVHVFDNEFKFARPLLCVGREEIVEYLQNRNLQWRTDHTNTDLIYRRNYIRHRLLPELQKYCNDSLVEKLSELSDEARGFYKKICSQADTIWQKIASHDDDKIILDLKIFQSQPKPVKVELIRRALGRIGCGQRDLTQGHYERILDLADENVTCRKIELPGGFIARREYGKLIVCRVGLAPPSPYRPIKVQPVILNIPGKTRFGDYIIDSKILEKDEQEFEKYKAVKTDLVERFDLDKVKPPLTVRFRQEGDRFVPLGLDREKKVGKFLTAARVPYEVRQKILIVVDSEKIIWVRPIRISEQAKVTDQTKKILQLQIVYAKPES